MDLAGRLGYRSAAGRSGWLQISGEARAPRSWVKGSRESSAAGDTRALRCGYNAQDPGANPGLAKTIEPECLPLQPHATVVYRG